MFSNLRPWLVLAAAALPLRAQLTSSLCPAVTLSATDFEATELFNRKGDNGATKDADLTEPVHFDVRVVNNASGKYDHSDIIYVERTGNLKYYDGAAKTVKIIGTISVHALPSSQDDNGLMGVVFDPNYETNRWIYLWYSPKQLYQHDNVTTGGQNRQLRLARFTLKSDNSLDMASEKSLIKILASKTDTWHSGGPMQFDAYGDLWIAIGNNSLDLDPTACNTGGSVLSQTDSSASAEWGSSNTHSMRGGFIRIHPDDAAPKGYTIPKGNFGEYWADQFDKQGNATLAAQYRDTSKVLPEVYVKGERSNFSCAVHPTKRWLAWGTVNYNSSSDEYNITDHPIFSGFPYFMADNQPTCTHGKSADKPTNNSKFNSGVVDLPPAIGGTLNYSTTKENVAIGGPIYSFDPSLDYDYKFPPHFDNHWFVGSYASSHYYVVTVDASGSPLKASGSMLKLDQTGLLKNASFRNYLQSTFGKDGALYFLNYDGQTYGAPSDPGVVRVIYKGSCHVPVSARKVVAPYQSIWIDPLGITIKEAGPHMVALYDLKGHRVWNDQDMGPKVYRLSDIRARASLRPGLYMARVNTPAGEVSQRISVF
jgi:cytochrome c